MCLGIPGSAWHSADGGHPPPLPPRISDSVGLGGPESCISHVLPSGAEQALGGTGVGSEG